MNSRPKDDAGLKDLLEYLKTSRGFDFTGYKTASLERRIAKRMADAGVEGYRDYLDFLEVNPSEFAELFDTILINVTSFFRDPEAWDYLRDSIVPRLLEEIPADDPVRVWCAGCSSGEEAYTVAIVLAEALGEDAFKARVKVYATDVDEAALNTARQATYPAASFKDMPEALTERYFERTPLGLSFRSDLRRSLIFGRNDLVQDAPISRIDLLISRNTLIYFTAEAQAEILDRLNFALSPWGYLFLGRSEMLITHTELFEPDNVKYRFFRAVPRLGLEQRLAFLGDEAEARERGDGARATELHSAAADAARLAQVIIDPRGRVTLVNAAARTLFALGGADIGRPLRDLEASYRPADLRSGVEQAEATKKQVELGRFHWPGPDGGELLLDIRVTPITGADGELIGTSIAFEDVTTLDALDTEREHAKRELQTAYEELQSTVEELETTNEELQSTNEELETTNEELQSTNEELETMNEELHSTNDELETMNEDQRSRGGELDRAKLFLEGILESLGVGVVVVDSDHVVQVWNAASEELWGLRSREVEGLPLRTLDTGMPVESVDGLLKGAIAGSPQNDVLEAVNRRGRAFRCWVRATPLKANAGAPYGALLLMADEESGGVPSGPVG